MTTTITLSSLIAEVEAHSTSPEPLALLATASASVEQINDLSDALLSHFVDRSRRAGHSWTEIGAALGVTKQAVQKRFTAERREPPGFERYTPRAKRVVSVHAPAVAAELGHNYLGTEHLLAGFWGEAEGIAAKALEAAGVTRQSVIAGIDARVPRDQQGQGGFTPRAWVALQNSLQIALGLGHNYIGTEHQLLALVSGVGGMAEVILGEQGLTADALRTQIVTALEEYSAGSKT